MTVVDNPGPTDGPIPLPRGRGKDKPGKITPALIKERYQAGLKATRLEQQRYWINTAFLQGEQWVYIHKTRNQLVANQSAPKRVRATIPRLRPESRRIIAKILKRKLVFEVPPSAGDSATIQGARIGAAVLEAARREQNWERIREDHAWAAWQGGTGLLCLDWDASAGVKLEYHPDTRKAVGTGDVRISSLSVLEAYTVPGSLDIEREWYWIKAQAMPGETVQRLYNLSTKPAADATAALSPYQQRLLAEESGSPAHDLSLVLTYYERPNELNPEGTVSVLVGSEVVEESGWPFPFTNRLNITATPEIYVRNRWTGDTIVSDAVPIQTALNASWSNILEHQKYAANARLQVADYSLDLMEELTDQPGEIIPYNPAMGEAKWLSPPQMPAWWLDQPQALKAELDDALGVHDISRGSAPANVESGSGLAILAEQDETPSAGLAGKLAEAWGKIASMVLECYADKVKDTRTARLSHGPGKPGEVVRWNGKKLMGQTVATVPYDSIAPTSEAQRKAEGFMLYDRKVIQTPQELAAYIDIPTGPTLMGQVDPDVAAAENENHVMAQGLVVLPEPWEDHAKHIDTLNRFRKTERFRLLEDKAKEIFELHGQAHETMAAEEAGRVAGQAEINPALAGAPKADQPAMPPEMAQPPIPQGPPSEVDALLGQAAELQGQGAAMAGMGGEMPSEGDLMAGLAGGFPPQ